MVHFQKIECQVLNALNFRFYKDEFWDNEFLENKV